MSLAARYHGTGFVRWRGQIFTQTTIIAFKAFSVLAKAYIAVPRLSRVYCTGLVFYII